MNKLYTPLEILKSNYINYDYISDIWTDTVQLDAIDYESMPADLKAYLAENADKTEEGTTESIYYITLDEDWLDLIVEIYYDPDLR